MILYTPLSETDVFPYAKEQSHQNRHIISHGGKMVYAEKTDDGNYQLLQLMSTDPQDFLDEKFTPGTIISSEINP